MKKVIRKVTKKKVVYRHFIDQLAIVLNQPEEQSSNFQEYQEYSDRYHANTEQPHLRISLDNIQDVSDHSSEPLIVNVKHS